MPLESVFSILATIGAIVGFTEWRYRAIHSCTRRIEQRLDRHLDKQK